MSDPSNQGLDRVLDGVLDGLDVTYRALDERIDPSLRQAAGHHLGSGDPS